MKKLNDALADIDRDRGSGGGGGGGGSARRRIQISLRLGCVPPDMPDRDSTSRLFMLI